jgi:uncharacterized membrane protein
MCAILMASFDQVFLKLNQKRCSMTLRMQLYELVATHPVTPTQLKQLEKLAGLHAVPLELDQTIKRGVASLAAGLGGFGVILWLAANWGGLGRFGRFALLEGVVLVMAMGSFYKPHWRAPLGLMALLCTGGLLAYFGQTYQTGADVWQLFAFWAALTLPLCLSVRSDITWTPWMLVFMTALQSWMVASHLWFNSNANLNVWVAVFALVITFLMHPFLKRWTGAGVWAWRLGATFSVALMVCQAIADFDHLFGRVFIFHFGVLIALGVVLAQKRFFDIYALSAVALGLNVCLVVCLFQSLVNRRFSFGGLLLLGLLAAAALAGTTTWLLKLVREHKTSEVTS